MTNHCLLSFRSFLTKPLPFQLTDAKSNHRPHVRHKFISCFMSLNFTTQRYLNCQIILIINENSITHCVPFSFSQAFKAAWKKANLHFLPNVVQENNLLYFLKGYRAAFN